MAEEVRERLKDQYNLSDEAIDDILKSGAEGGLINLAQPQGPPTAKTAAPHSVESLESPLLASPKGGAGDPGAELLRALKEGGDLDEVMRFMIIDNWVQERFGKGKIPADVQAALDELKSAKKPTEDSIDKLISQILKYDLLFSIMDRRNARNQPPQQQTQAIDIQKAINDLGEKMTNALKEHKAEDERRRLEERAKKAEEETAAMKKQIDDKKKQEEEDQRVKDRVQAAVEPLEKEFQERVKIINERLQNVPKEERSKYLLDLNDILTSTVGEEIKGRIITSIQGAFAPPEEPTVTPSGQVNWFKLGEKGLKVLDNFIQKIPTRPPEKKAVKQMPMPALKSKPGEKAATEPKTETPAKPKPKTETPAKPAAKPETEPKPAPASPSKVKPDIEPTPATEEDTQAAIEMKASATSKPATKPTTAPKPEKAAGSEKQIKTKKTEKKVPQTPKKETTPPAKPKIKSADSTHSSKNPSTANRKQKT